MTPHENKVVRLIMNDDSSVELISLEELPEGVWMGFKAPFLCRRGKHLNIVPEDVGLGPYDSKARAIYEAWLTSGGDR